MTVTWNDPDAELQFERERSRKNSVVIQQLLDEARLPATNPALEMYKMTRPLSGAANVVYPFPSVFSMNAANEDHDYKTPVLLHGFGAGAETSAWSAYDKEFGVECQESSAHKHVPVTGTSAVRFNSQPSPCSHVCHEHFATPDSHLNHHPLYPYQSQQNSTYYQNHRQCYHQPDPRYIHSAVRNVTAVYCEPISLTGSVAGSSSDLLSDGAQMTREESLTTSIVPTDLPHSSILQLMQDPICAHSNIDSLSPSVCSVSSSANSHGISCEESPYSDASIPINSRSTSSLTAKSLSANSSSSSISAESPNPNARYVCPKCGKAFARPSSLSTHMNIHTGEKPYKCMYPNCNKQFNAKSNMLRHYKLHLKKDKAKQKAAAAKLKSKESK